MRKCLYAYAWDFVDEGTDAVCERIKSLGVDAVAMAVSYHAGKFILPHNPRHRVYFPEDGTVYFAPRKEYYPGPIKPATASFVETGDVLADVAEGCGRFGLKLIAWTVCMHNTRLGTKHPEFTVKNAFGDRYPYSLCPAQSEAADYALGLIGDLTQNYDLDTIFLESLAYMGFSHGYHHEFFGVMLDECQESLLSLCFCDACIKRARKAGVDVDRVAGLVRARIGEAFGMDVEGPGCDLNELVQTNAELGAYLDMRCEVVSDLVGQAKTVADKNDVKIDFFGPVYDPSCARAFVEGTDVARIASIADHYVIPAGSPDVDAVAREIGYVKALTSPEKIVLSINMGMNSVPDRENFQQKMVLVREHDLAGCNLYNYSTLPFARLDWIGEEA